VIIFICREVKSLREDADDWLLIRVDVLWQPPWIESGAFILQEVIMMRLLQLHEEVLGLGIQLFGLKVNHIE